ncbi:hypothetical protein [Streptomyces justiciae]|uniref:hypothetical protein n=1 Tax=Streptomyces justiciae TaxID=2780140 RepID=UPI001882372D|nr:hypothetical protein [Streptomyces justiciae]MBE8475428.1 hypothetical protein [Streptomyces justiciae]
MTRHRLDPQLARLMADRRTGHRAAPTDLQALRAASGAPAGEEVRAVITAMALLDKVAEA